MKTVKTGTLLNADAINARRVIGMIGMRNCANGQTAKLFATRLANASVVIDVMLLQTDNAGQLHVHLLVRKLQMKTVCIGIPGLINASVIIVVKDIGMIVQNFFANFQIPHVPSFSMTQASVQLVFNAMLQFKDNAYQLQELPFFVSSVKNGNGITQKLNYVKQ